MIRVLLIVAVVLAIALAVRHAVVETMREGRASKRRPGEKKRGPRAPELPPTRIVCEACGHAFDPEATGWICPKCGK